MGYTPGQNLGGLAVDLGGIPLGRVDAAGVAWSLQDLQGWDSPEVRAPLTQREGDHGAWSAPVYLGERPVTLSGTVTAPDARTLDDAREQLLAAASVTDTVVVVYEAVPKQAIAHRSGKPLWAYVTDTIATFSVLMTAQDPRRYDVTQQAGSTGLPVSTGGRPTPYAPPYTLTATTVSGEIDAVNGGTFETRPVIIINGPVSQPQVLAALPDGSVRPMTYSQDLGVGDQLVIDVAAKSCVLNGAVSRRRFLALPLGWPVIPAQSTVAFTFSAVTYSASALLTVQWRSAWI